MKLKIVQIDIWGSTLPSLCLVYFNRPLEQSDFDCDETLTSLSNSVSPNWTVKHGTYWIYVPSKEELTYLVLKYGGHCARVDSKP